MFNESRRSELTSSRLRVPRQARNDGAFTPTPRARNYFSAHQGHADYPAAIATLLCWTISTFVLAKLSRLVSPAVLNKAALFFGIFLFGAIVCVVDGIQSWQLFTLPKASNWLWLGLADIFGKSLGDYCGFYAFAFLVPEGAA